MKKKTDVTLLQESERYEKIALILAVVAMILISATIMVFTILSN